MIMAVPPFPSEPRGLDAGRGGWASGKEGKMREAGSYFEEAAGNEPVSAPAGSLKMSFTMFWGFHGR
jgi:hypothetical protein